MKKIYLLAGMALVSTLGFAQEANKFDAASLTANPGVVTSGVKAPTDTVTMETFDAGQTWGAWTASGQNDHTSGDWYLETTFPASLSGQPQIPFTAFSGTMGGNVAFINSDAEGGSAFQDALYTSPAIDLSAMGTTPLSLQWQAQWRRFQELHFVYVSNDNGSTWTEFAVDVVAVNTNSDDPQYADVNITSANGGAAWGTQVMIQFRYDAQWDWFWAIDNVAIIETPADDLSVTAVKDHYTGARIKYSKIPTGQVAAMDLDAEVSNVGAATQATSQLDVNVSGAGTFTGSSPSTSIASGTSAKLTVSGFTPSALGTYNVAYNVYDPATVDASPADNVGLTSFEVTQYTYAKDTNGLDGWWGPFDDDTDGIDDPLELIPEFEFNASETIYGLAVVVMGGGATPQTPVGQEIYYNVYSDDGAGNFVPEYDGLTIPVPTYTITAADLTAGSGSEVWLGLQLPSPVVADPAISPVWYPVVGYSIDSAFFAVSGDAADTTNYMSVFATTAGQSNYFITSVPMLRFSTDPAFPASGPLGITTEDANVALGQNMPNPFNSNTVIPFSLVNAATVEFVVTDMMGKIIENRELGTLSTGDHTINFNGSDLASGFYYYSVIVDGKRSTKKFAVAK